MDKINFEKNNGLIPAIIQDYKTNLVYMLGYMNKISLEQTQKTGFVHFFSRSRKKLWMKGETSKNFLIVQDIKPDCDKDVLLIKAKPAGPRKECPWDHILFPYLKRVKIKYP